jgi:hypothetical protein
MLASPQLYFKEMLNRWSELLSVGFPTWFMKLRIAWVANPNTALQHSQADKRWLKQSIASIHLFIQTREKTNHNILTFKLLIFFSHFLLYNLYCFFSLGLYLNMLIFTRKPVYWVHKIMSILFFFIKLTIKSLKMTRIKMNYTIQISAHVTAHNDRTTEFTFSTFFHFTFLSNHHTYNKRQLKVRNFLLLLYFCLQNALTLVKNRTCFKRPFYIVKRVFYPQTISISPILVFKAMICYISS